MSGYEWVPLLVLGFAGQGHCVGMCGPIVATLPASRNASGHLLYHTGRLLTYAGIGAALGGLGGSLAGTASLQTAISALSALFLLFLALIRLGFVREPAWATRVPGVERVLQAAARGSGGAPLVLGLLLGFLPCGLSWAAFSRALAAPGALEGASLTLAFGLGTVPALLLLGTALGPLFRRYRREADVLSGMLMIGLAARIGADVVLRLRG